MCEPSKEIGETFVSLSFSLALWLQFAIKMLHCCYFFKVMWVIYVHCISCLKNKQPWKCCWRLCALTLHWICMVYIIVNDLVWKSNNWCKYLYSWKIPLMYSCCVNCCKRGECACAHTHTHTCTHTGTHTRTQIHTHTLTHTAKTVWILRSIFNTHCPSFVSMLRTNHSQLLQVVGYIRRRNKMVQIICK